MDFFDHIRELSARIPKQLEHIQTEEATKNALVLPFIAALGYNIFDPQEVVPEYTADVGVKKGEKVDYLIIVGGKPAILIECKWRGADLDKEHASQLYRYFSVTSARFAILTNGVSYRFYTDLEEPNKMDSKPFLEVNMADIQDPAIRELKKFAKGIFNVEVILNTASDLKYTREIKRILAEQLVNPSEEFIRFVASQVYSGKLTQNIRAQFVELIKKAFQQFISERISDRLKSALAEENASITPNANESVEEANKELIDPVVTTEEELQAYYIVKALLRDKVDAKRIVIRDALSYCSILLDDNNRKPICRLYFNSSTKRLGLFDEQKTENKVVLGSLDDFFQYASQIQSVISYYDQTK